MFSNKWFIPFCVLALTAVGLAQEDGVIIGWGSNVGPVQGEGDPPYYGQATPPGGNDFSAIDAGRYHSIALKSDGSLEAWGISSGGTLDYNYGQVTATPAGSNYIAITAGRDHNVAIRTDTTLDAWGRNDHGQASPPSGSGFIEVAAGELHSLALRSDGTLAAWGITSGTPSNGYYGQTVIPGGSDYIAVACGTYHSLAIAAQPGTAAGSISAWGRNTNGQASPPAGTDFIAVDGESSHSLALRSDGTLAAWGIVIDSPYGWERELYGDFGQVTNTPSDSGYIAIAAGDFHNVALKSDGTVVAWGKNNKDQATAPAGSNFFAVAGGGEHSLAIESNTPITRYTLSVTSQGASDIAIDSSTGHGGVTNYFRTLDPGTTVTLTAPATSGTAAFTGWSGAVSSTSPTISLTMNASKSVTANYVPQYTLAVSSAGAGNVPIENPNDKGYGGVTDYTRQVDTGDTVWLVAPDTVDGKTFTGWTGSINSTNTYILFPMDADTSVTANYQTPTQKYTLFVYSAGATGVSISSSTGHGGTTNYTKTLDEDTLVTLTAPSSWAEAVFTGWSGAVNSGSQTITLTMDAVKSVTANYVTQYTLSVNSAGASGVLVSSTTGHDGVTDYTKPSLNSGTYVNLQAPQYVGTGALRKRFTSWSGSVSSTSWLITLTMTGNKTVTANYVADPVTYTLTTSTTGSGSVSADPVGGTYVAGTEVTLTAAPAAGWDFVGWQGDLSGSVNPDTIVMEGNKSVTAVFELTTYTLSVISSGVAGVSISSTTGHGGTTNYIKTVNDGTTVTLTAPVIAGKTFTGWTGSMTSANATLSFSMNANSTVVANYETTTYTLSTSTTGSGSVSADPSGGTYASGTVVTLTAIPEAGWHFDQWQGNLTGSANPDTLTM
ncbi:MAG: hypothetical protein JRE18_09410, partial [Deltaproteobacteria bacterium]|nr:hypothetical protein [Deltaproteobacteria bacterium]